jgi:hypothetical protein
LRKFQTDYVATVEADFEILSHYFIREMMDSLESDPQLIGISSDYSAGASQCYDSYSGKVLSLAERWNTWFSQRLGQRLSIRARQRGTGRVRL